MGKTVMTLKENSNCSCFESWLQEYKSRLQQVHLQGCLSNGDQSAGLVSGTGELDRQEDDSAPSSPAAAGESYVAFARAVIV